MNRYASQQYNSDEVTRIIRRALKMDNEDKVSHRDLIHLFFSACGRTNIL